MNFLKNLFTSKKEKSEKKKQLNLSMPLFKGKQAYSLDQVVQELKFLKFLGMILVQHL